MIYEIFNHKHLQENAITIIIVKIISTDIWDQRRVSLKGGGGGGVHPDFLWNLVSR